MRSSFVRRVVAALFVVVGLGVGSSAVQADAATVHANSAPTHATTHQKSPADWLW